MKIKIKCTIIEEEEVDVQLPLFWKLDNWFHKLEENIEAEAVQLTSVSSNCISCTLMTTEQFAAYYGHYKGLYNECTESEFQNEFDRLNNYLR